MKFDYLGAAAQQVASEASSPSRVSVRGAGGAPRAERRQAAYHFDWFTVRVVFCRQSRQVGYFARLPSSKSLIISFMRFTRVSSRLALSIQRMKFFR